MVATNATRDTLAGWLIYVFANFVLRNPYSGSNTECSVEARVHADKPRPQSPTPSHLPSVTHLQGAAGKEISGTFSRGPQWADSGLSQAIKLWVRKRQMCRGFLVLPTHPLIRQWRNVTTYEKKRRSRLAPNLCVRIRLPPYVCTDYMYALRQNVDPNKGVIHET